jgi:serine/threonine protein kinase
MSAASPPVIAFTPWARAGAEDRAYLDRPALAGAAPRIDGPWAHVDGRGALPGEGWKLHVSSTLARAPEVLDVVATHLRARGVAFKFARAPGVLMRLNLGQLGESQIGKFITVYPATADESATLARSLAELTRGFRGPVVNTDLRLGDVVYSRFGAYRPVVRRDPTGKIERLLRDPETGDLRPDAYEAPYDPAVHPFGADAAPACTPAASRALAERLAGEVLILAPLSAKVKGAVFLGFSLTRLRKVVVKTGRRDYVEDVWGRDMRRRVLDEARVLNKLAGTPGVPALERVIETDEMAALIRDHVPGRTLETLSKRPLADLSPDKILAVLEAARRFMLMVAGVHAKGVLHRDIAEKNVVFDDRLDPYLIDFELAFDIAQTDPPYTLGTDGFVSPQQARMAAPTEADDVYSAGMVALNLITGVCARNLQHMAGCRDEGFVRRLRRLTGLPPDALATLARTISPDARRRPSLHSAAGALEDAVATIARRTERHGSEDGSARALS